jgi:hypothetical protein
MSKLAEQYREIVEGLHSTHELHNGQIKIARALFYDEVKDIFAQLGRNWGKTEAVIYCHWRYAQSFPGSENYYFAPFMKQAREIVWATQRYQTYGPRAWITNINNTEMRITFANGSFIKCDGSDNVEAYRGVKPRGLVVYDEFKDFRPEFYDAFDPNRAAHNSPLLITGTPPDRECQFLQVAEEFRKNPSKRFIEGPTSENPFIKREWLDAKRQELIDRGEFDVWQREYEAIYVPGGISKIFPMLKKEIVKPHDQIMSQLKKDARKLEWILIADPAASTVFGTLYMTINPYTKNIYLLDEIYETEQARMTVITIGREILTKKKELWGDEWLQVYDEAETWFKNEMLDRFNEFFGAAAKASLSKEQGLSLIKDILLQGRLTISTRCQKLFWELDNYYKDKNGKIPKGRDHLIDCFRYGLMASGYSLSLKKEYIEEEDENFRGSKISDDFPELDDIGDLANSEWDV